LKKTGVDKRKEMWRRRKRWKRRELGGEGIGGIIIIITISANGVYSVAVVLK
jgi:hypothetical protein